MPPEQSQGSPDPDDDPDPEDPLSDDENSDDDPDSDEDPLDSGGHDEELPHELPDEEEDELLDEEEDELLDDELDELPEDDDDSCSGRAEAWTMLASSRSGTWLTTRVWKRYWPSSP